MNARTGGFTHDELTMLSDGILSMMENTSKAMAMIIKPVAWWRR